jgi:hypothetical protein
MQNLPTPSVVERPSALRREFSSSDNLLHRTLGPPEADDILQQQVLTRLLGNDNVLDVTQLLAAIGLEVP